LAPLSYVRGGQAQAGNDLTADPAGMPAAGLVSSDAGCVRLSRSRRAWSCGTHLSRQPAVPGKRAAGAVLCGDGTSQARCCPCARPAVTPYDTGPP